MEALKIHEVGVNERERRVAGWHTVQSRFVDVAHIIAVRLGQVEAWSLRHGFSPCADLLEDHRIG